MTILLTGAGGFLGAALWRLLQRERPDDRLIALTRRPVEGAYICDIADPPELLRTLDELTPQVIINLAAIADFGAGALARQYPVNTLAPGLMAQWCAAHDAYLLQASGTLVHGFGQTEFGPQTPIAPDTDYGQSKWLAEELIRASGARAGIVRIGGIYGAAGPDHLGLNRAIRGALAGQPPTLHGPGQAKRNYLHVDDCARMLLWCLDNQPMQTLWAGGAEILTLEQTLQRLCDALLPNAEPIREQGDEARDQVVHTSPQLPPGRTMLEALRAERDA
ncbi:NAD-dependent epimerase/dehydratase family protein [Magnetofaba australis]|uniref:Putative dTDP-glucose 4,6-dehydratase n=1 Tax=Magnetofaba australis IT-1 TaxID=1434232 RepID=A0A1Y2K2N6_9PROT|nr:NAD-dependent epimerase/dehydratase family protein [Magnetofaba australis]OSM02298.1 putative dTDP-glucose 4,6-dehydratase [Magnetofaba australis IT-1]